MNVGGVTRVVPHKCSHGPFRMLFVPRCGASKCVFSALVRVPVASPVLEGVIVEYGGMNRSSTHTQATETFLSHLLFRPQPVPLISSLSPPSAPLPLHCLLSVVWIQLGPATYQCHLNVWMSWLRLRPLFPPLYLSLSSRLLRLLLLPPSAPPGTIDLSAPPGSLDPLAPPWLDVTSSMPLTSCPLCSISPPLWLCLAPPSRRFRLGPQLPCLHLRPPVPWLHLGECRCCSVMASEACDLTQDHLLFVIH
ncbi:hypothetical protein DPX16_20121 [Anabarilius grahami]|uniref:Uncharacterized protein n=1 Tax=Anabarilius grahami TaxID=495550 RepID=A0A3N0XQR6_ANAGA|nr:hypothetical protein DPX16_20121 [Anabarilius grahami]